MTTKIVRIPVPQELWDSVRAAATKHLQATIDYERAAALYSIPQDGDDQAMRDGRDADLIRLTDAMAMTGAESKRTIAALAKAEAAHVMGLK